jgi:mannose-6-phosphate isomerase class I
MVHGLSAGNLVWELAAQNQAGLNLIPADQEKAEAGPETANVFDAICFESRQNPRISREAGSATHTRRILLTGHCPYFDVEEIRLHDHIYLKTSPDSFHLLTVIRNSVTLTGKDFRQELHTGNLCCIPACWGDYRLEADPKAPAEVLKCMMHLS